MKNKKKIKDIEIIENCYLSKTNEIPQNYWFTYNIIWNRDNFTQIGYKLLGKKIRKIKKNYERN